MRAPEPKPEIVRDGTWAYHDQDDRAPERASADLRTAVWLAGCRMGREGEDTRTFTIKWLASVPKTVWWSVINSACSPKFRSKDSRDRPTTGFELVEELKTILKSYGLGLS